MRKKTLSAILAHAAADYPRESCGLVVQNGRIERYFPCRNLAAHPTAQFHLSPHEYAAAEEWGTVIAIVHSHPDATTQPSPLDLAQCDATALPWYIVSWPEGDFRVIQPRGDLPLVGRPFVLGYSDCWGLVMDYYRLMHGITLHDYRVDRPWWEDGQAGNFYQDCWYECGFRAFHGEPQPGDVVIMQVQSKKWNHAGVLLEGTFLLHHLYGHLSQRVPYGGYWRDRTMKIVRHKRLII